MIFGITHTDPQYIRTLTERFVSIVDPVEYSCDSGQQYALCYASKFQTATQSLSVDTRFITILSGEVYSKHPVAFSKYSSKEPCSHAELFGHLFNQLGGDAIRATSGQFCAAVWDKEESSLSLFLDRSGGIKVLYYLQLPVGFVFCSSLNTLLSVTKIQRLVDAEVVRDLFATGYVVPPKTVVEHVYKVCPGQKVSYKNGTIQTRQVDSIQFDSSVKGKGSADHLKERLLNSLERYASEPETFFLLSGGLDSSTLVALASRHVRKPITTFTAAFPGSSLDESSYAKIVAEDSGCIYQEVDLSGAEALDDLPEIVWNLEEPFLDFSAIPTFQLFKKLSTKTRTLISGDGPDHLFGRYYPLAAKRYVCHRYTGLVGVGSLLSSLIRKKISNAGSVSLAEAYRGLFALPAWGDENVTLCGLVNMPSLDLAGSIERYSAQFQMPTELTFENHMDAVATLDFYLDGSFGVFAKIGRMADAHGLVVREPFLDREVSDYIAQLPLHQKQSGTLMHLLASKSRDKRLLKADLAPKYLPRAILKKKKGGFTPPLGNWLRKTVCLIPASKLLCKTLRTYNLLNETVIDRILQEHRSGQRDWSRIIFLIISFDLWLRMFIETEHSTFPGWKLKDIYAA
ncbi:MAG: asparagine synthase C-terminal domain-containing protein [Geobacteraceae bacterium]|nr:asparagine synthase C-terminal domain-containing protein [Geobacteraceae bacterium]